MTLTNLISFWGGTIFGFVIAAVLAKGKDDG